MRLGYIRIREGGPPEDVQRRSLAAADVSSQHALYGDGTTTVPQRRDDPNDPLAQRSWVLRHLRPGDELLVHDAATLGTSADDILNVLTIIDERHATLYVIESKTTYLWLRQADEIIALAVNGIKADIKTAKGGSTKILTPKMHARALELWSDPNIRPAQTVARMLQLEFKVKISVRTLQKYLPNRNELLRYGLGYAKNGQQYPLNNPSQTMITDSTPRRMRLKSIPPDLIPGLPMKDQEAIQSAIGHPVIVRDGNEKSVLDHPRTEVEFRVGDVIHTIWVRPSDLEEMS